MHELACTTGSVVVMVGVCAEIALLQLCLMTAVVPEARLNPVQGSKRAFAACR